MTDDFQGTYITENGISKVVVNSGLFFLLDAFSSGIDREEIIEAGSSFISFENLVSLKTLVWNMTKCRIKPIERRGKAAATNTLNDILDCMAEYDSADFVWPIIVPKNIREIPVLKSESSVRLDRLVSSCEQKLTNLSKDILHLQGIVTDRPPSFSEIPTE